MVESSDDRCRVPRCKRPGAMKFYGRPVCDPCWNKYQAEDQPPFILKKILGVTPDEEPKDLSPHRRTGHDEFDAERLRAYEATKPVAPVVDEKREKLKRMLMRWKARSG